jgi:hypothetical protein
MPDKTKNGGAEILFGGSQYNWTHFRTHTQSILSIPTCAKLDLRSNSQNITEEQNRVVSAQINLKSKFNDTQKGPLHPAGIPAEYACASNNTICLSYTFYQQHRLCMSFGGNTDSENNFLR